MTAHTTSIYPALNADMRRPKREKVMKNDPVEKRTRLEDAKTEGNEHATRAIEKDRARPALAKPCFYSAL
jgi:hypothetical protein